MQNKFLDIKDLNKLKKVILNNQPDFIPFSSSIFGEKILKIHETFCHSLGTLNILEAVKSLKKNAS